MTEPQAGADPGEFTCTALKDGDHWVINGEKWFASHARFSAFLLVMVVTNPDGEIEWFNHAFTEMCDYTLPELKGRKPGHVLQGPDTDPATVARIRTAISSRQRCRETIVNYHKDGSRYEADVRIAPILDDDRQPLWFVAQERKLQPAAPVSV